MNTQNPDILPLGSLPRPTSGDDLAARLRTALLTYGGVDAASAGALQVSATLAGADITTLDVDLTGVELSPREARAAQASAAAVEAARRERGTIGALSVQAHPVTVLGAGVDLQLDVAGVSFEWVEGTDGRLGLAPVEPDEAHPVTGAARVAVPVQAIEAAAERVATQLAAANGLKLTRLDLRLSPAGANGVAVVVDAQVKKSLLSATVEASMTATVDDALGVTLSDVKVTSRNPVVAGLLVAARSRVERFDGRRIDLVSALPAGIRLADVRVTVGDEVVLTARAQ
ncbi:hypothetical protein [Cellulomonas persica]|uniref:Uncharacterized protein n=1 Tax=Cellulomonas persica TaxID=76861 RepID=A0A510UPG7_9CELL|nr:hypothetical protein [Cellulomonas persica]GEK16554.1 hypothetical protein CPE01_02870 [Cellulomonas persica]